MRITKSLTSSGTALVVAVALLLPVQKLMAQAAAGGDSQVQSEVTKALDNKRLKGVSAKVQDGVAMLSGSVSMFSDKQEAEKKVRKVKAVTRIDDQIQVTSGAEISDQSLTEKLSKQLAYDRVGYGTTAFNAVTVRVQNGVVTLGGVVYGPPDKDSALGLVGNTAGVKDVVDHILVAPPSPNDDRIRRDVARVIYGNPGFTRYQVNPVKPIRIIVVNGNVTLVGSVDTKGDAELANIRANQVGGVFKVTNDLQYPGKHGEQ